MSSNTTGYVGRAHRGAWLVYLNGIEVPCPNVSVSYGVGQIPEATLNFPPHRLLHRVGAEDRLEVAIFYLDTLIEPENPQFRLLFEGEVVGWSYVNSATGRQLSFNAVADIAIFTQMNFHFLNSADAIAGHVVANDPSGVPQAGSVYPFSLFKKGLVYTENVSNNKVPAPDITVPFEILYNVVRGLVDANLSPRVRSVPGVNFFARWVRKRNFVNRFAALPLLEEGGGSSAVFPILEAAQATSALETLQTKISTSVGNAGTIMDVLREVFGHVLFEIAMLPTAPVFRANISDGTILGSPQNPPPVAEGNPRQPIRLLNYFVKPQVYFGIAPMCNVFFPSMITSYSYSENYITQPTRTYVSEQLIANTLKPNPLNSLALQLGYPDEVNAVLRAKVGGTDPASTSKQVTASGTNVLLYPEEFYKGPLANRMPVPKWFTYLMNQATKNKNGTDTTQTSIQTLLSSYVTYEHFRGRYAKRGGAVNLAWNPYPVPGFPCVIFDQESSEFHTVGYLNSVTQNLSVGQMYTAVNYGMGRTLPEMFSLLKEEITKTNKVWGSAPLETVQSIRDIIQDFTKAESFYNGLFFRKQAMPAGKKSSFDFREVVEYKNADGSREAIYAAAPTTVGVSTAEGETQQVQVAGVNNLSGDRLIVGSKKYEAAFNQYDTAMALVARPICTLGEYITFLYGEGYDGNALIGSGDIELGDQKFGQGVLYYKRIKKLRYVDVDPNSLKGAATNVTSVNGQVAPFTSANAATPSTLPANATPGMVAVGDTRANWDTVLIQYQAEMYNRKAPQK